MELNSKLTGTKLKDFHMEVTWRETMNYAAATGDNNPCYFDDERKEGIVAPPLFAEAVTWQISKEMWEYMETDEFPGEVLVTLVHYSEHIQFHRLIVPGDKILIKGELAAILPHRAGTHLVLKYAAVDKDGDPVFTTYTGAMLRGVKCVGGGEGEESLPEVRKQSEGSSLLWEVVIPIDPLAAHVYDGCADISHPIHTSPRFARGVGLPGIILQGTATLSRAVRSIVDREAGGDPYKLKSIYCRFKGMVLPGSDIKMQLTGDENRDGGRDLFFTVLNAEGKEAISGGCVRLE